MKYDGAPIDFVITWVDGNDPNWISEFEKYSGARDSSSDCRLRRYRDMDLLRYWFRGVEKYAPWVRKIFFVTCGQKPEWLDTDNEKLVMVDHCDYMPKEYLPTFNSSAILLNLHRIKGLSERFVVFDDDMFIMNNVSPLDFFKNGLPCESAVMDYISPRGEIPFLIPGANVAVLNRHFAKKDILRKQFAKYYNIKYSYWNLKNILLAPGKLLPGFAIFHLPNSILRSTYEEVWDEEHDVLNRTSLRRVRGTDDVNQWLMKDWQLCKGQFVPRSTGIGTMIDIDSDEALNRAVDAIGSRKYKMVCINDNCDDDMFDRASAQLVKAFEKILPDRSSFEV